MDDLIKEKWIIRSIEDLYKINKNLQSDVFEQSRIIMKLREKIEFLENKLISEEISTLDKVLNFK